MDKLSEEEKDIEYLEKYINWETYGERSLEKAIKTILDLYQKEKEKNTNIKEQMEKMNIADAGSLLAEFDRLECIEDEADEIRVAYQKEKEKNKKNEIDLTTVYIDGVETEKRKWRDKIKAKIKELQKEYIQLFEMPRKDGDRQSDLNIVIGEIDVLQKLLEEERYV